MADVDMTDAPPPAKEKAAKTSKADASDAGAGEKKKFEVKKVRNRKTCCEMPLSRFLRRIWRLTGRGELW
jgi:hypothetical protein